MDITISGEPKEIAALVVALQEQQAIELNIDGEKVSTIVRRLTFGTSDEAPNKCE